MPKLMSFFEENGAYLFLSTLGDRPGRILRNRMLGAKLGVRKIQIGPRSHLRGLSSVSMGEDFSAEEGLWIEAICRYGDQQFQPRIVIGNHVRISRWSHIACTHSVKIGDHVLIGSKVTITDHNHGLFGTEATPPTVPPSQRPLEADRFVEIGSHVWLGDGVVVCPGVVVGECSVVAANAVVTRDVAPFSLVAGVPARAIRRFDAAQGAWVQA